MEAESVKVRVRFKADDTLPAGERMWACPVVAHDGGGTYELRNTSLYVPLAVGDVVRAELDADGMLQVVDVVCPGPMVMSWSMCRVPDDAAMIGDRWRERGASWSEGTSGMLATVWEEGVDRRQAEDVLDAEMRAGQLTWRVVIDPDERVADSQETIDFALDDERHIPEVTTSYWAPDDPYWAAHGLHTPDFLAQIQALAGEVQELASALEVGDHAAAGEILAFMHGKPLW